MKKLLVFAPHPDDEINLLCGLFHNFKDNGFHITVCFTTNGDNVRAETEQRFREALKVKELLGYDDLIILGYGDGYKGKTIYESRSNSPAESVAGYYQTYDVGNLKTYHSLKYGSQALYTFNNYKSDIKDLILDLYADIILCVDIDKHPEHRTLSLLFDEVIGEILKTKKYRPIILKKFAYIGVYDGVRDYFKRPMFKTVPSYKAKMVGEDSVFPYLWEERISFQENEYNYPLRFWNSPLFSALKTYHSQRVAVRFSQICNADVVFWVRRVDSLSYDAELSSSSGDVEFINDFKIVNLEDVELPIWQIPLISKNSWKPSDCDFNPEILFRFKKSETVEKFVIYQDRGSIIKKLTILLNNGYEYNSIETDRYKINIVIPRQDNITEVRFLFDRFGNSLISINEIEIYSSANCKIDQLRVIENNIQQTENPSIFLKIGELFYKILFSIFYLLYVRNKSSIIKRTLKRIKRNISVRL